MAGNRSRRGCGYVDNGSRFPVVHIPTAQLQLILALRSVGH